MPFFWFLFVQTLRTLFVNRLTLWLGKTKLGIWLKNNFDIVFKDEKRDFVPIYRGKIKQLNYIKTFLSKHLY